MSKKCILAAVAVLVTSPALAHVSLETKQATIGSSYKAVFAVPHGCAGSATTKIRVQIPEGVIAAKPMPKNGWNVVPSSTVMVCWPLAWPELLLDAHAARPATVTAAAAAAISHLPRLIRWPYTVASSS